MLKDKSKTQSMIVYAALVALVAVSLLAMSRYIANAVKGKYREAGDAVGKGEVYKPGR